MSEKSRGAFSPSYDWEHMIAKCERVGEGRSDGDTSWGGLLVGVGVVKRKEGRRGGKGKGKAKKGRGRQSRKRKAKGVSYRIARGEGEPNIAGREAGRRPSLGHVGLCE